MLIPSAGQPDLGVLDNMIIEKWVFIGQAYPFVIRFFNSINPSLEGRIVAARWDETNNPVIMSSVPLNDDNWHHVAFVKDGPMLHIIH